MPVIMSIGCAVFATTAAGGQTASILGQAADWTPRQDTGEAEVAVAARAEGGLTVTVRSDGGAESYPRIGRVCAEPQDWTASAAIQARVRVDCADPDVRRKRLAIVVYDRNTLRLDLPDRPMAQQVLAHTIPVGQWVDTRDWVLALGRSAVAAVELYLYEEPPTAPHEYTWQIADLSLEQVAGHLVTLDRTYYAEEELRRPGGPEEAAGEVGTDDGLRLALTADGAVADVATEGRSAGGAGEWRSGLLVRDAATTAAPVVVGGVRRAADGLTQEARLTELGLAVRARYRSLGECLEVTGELEDLRGQDRAITLYFAVPLGAGEWTWWDSVAASRPVAGVHDLSYCEDGDAFGACGAQSYHPLGAVTSADRAGLTLAVRMDEPVVHRVGASPSLRLFYLALDLGLAPETTVRGRPLSRAPFRFLLYRHDAAWGLRSALARYYRLFPQFFTKRAEREGGWYVWGNMQEMPEALDAGFMFHWGPASPAAIAFDNQAGTVALNYIEPELYQQTLGDFDRAPTAEEASRRLEQAAAGDTAAPEALGYTQGGGGHLPGGAMQIWLRDHTLSQYIQAISAATAASVDYDAAGQPQTNIGQYPWIGDSGWASQFPCNLDPDIPRGKGWFNREVALGLAFRVWEEAGVRLDGIGLDSLGGFGNCYRLNYRRDHFRYADTPLCFATEDRRPVIVHAFSTIEWVRSLAEEMHRQGKLLMANCSWHITPAWLTFVAPYLDVFGAEATRFADPEFIRAIAYQKPCTDLPYNPRPEWEVKWHLLHGIFPGHGNEVEVLRRYAPLLREMAAAGWEPVTYARVEPATLRVERFGHGERLFLAVHNPASEPCTASLALDRQGLELGDGPLRNALTGEVVAVTDGRVSMGLAGQDTLVLTTWQEDER